MYLRRRVEHLINDVRSGRAVLAPEVAERLNPELEKVKFFENGYVDLSTCSEHLRAVARAYHLADESTSAPAEAAQEAPPDVKEIVRLNRSLFELFDHTFIEALGSHPSRFARDGEDFGTAVRRFGEQMASTPSQAQRYASRAHAAVMELAKHYRDTNMPRMLGAKALPGSKLVLGGTQSFYGSSLRAVRSMLLYCDTVLIPDPVFPFLEVARTEERFSHVRIFEQIYYLSRLRPLVDADLPYPAIAIFPSWEKLLEHSDHATRDGLELQMLRLMSHFCQSTFEDIDELMEFAHKHPNEIVDTLSKNRLFLPPNGNGTEPFSTAIAMQREMHKKWRSTEYLQRLELLPDAELALEAIFDRLGPQFHLKENAEFLSASPLMALPQQWHYFRLLRKVETSALIDQKLITPNTNQLIESLTQPPIRWLGNIPIEDLIYLRTNLENERFRRDLDTRMKDLGGADEATLDGVTSRVIRALTTMTAEHDKEVRRIADDYKKKHTETAIGAWITLGSLFIPAFPVVGPIAAAVGVATKYGIQKTIEKMTYNQNRRTLLGFLAAASKAGDDD